MKIDFTNSIKGLDGKDVSSDTGTLTLKSVATNALMAAYPDEQHLSGEDKFKRYQLATKVQADEADLTPEEITLLKQLIGKLYAPLVVGRAYEILNG